MRTNPMVKVAVVGVVGLALTGIGVAPQLSARVTGDEIRLRVAPVDPVDPFRGAYVDLSYPDLPGGTGEDWRSADTGEGDDVFVVLERRGEVWVATDWARERPDDGTYLACTDRSWQVRCGIESWFLPQDEAAAMQERVAGGAIATVRVDDWGHAALTGVSAD